MANRKQSAKERTGKYVLAAAVLAGLGGGTAAAVPPKKASGVQKKTAVVTDEAKKQLSAVKKTTRKKSTAGRKSSRKGSGSSQASSALEATREQAQAVPAPAREIASAVVPKADTASAFRTDAFRSGRPSTAERIIGGGLNGRNLAYGQEDEFRKAPVTSYVPTDLVRVSPEFALEKSKPLFLREEAAASMERMIRDAAAEGVTLRVVSAYRDVAHQTRLYQSAIKRYGKGQKMVGRPGRSEHFLGTTVDVSNTNPSHLLQAAFGKSAEYRWLEANAAKYGWKFTVRSTKYNGRKPSQDEPWHIRYMGNPTVTAATETATAGVEHFVLPEAFTELFGRVRQFLSRMTQAPAESAPSDAESQDDSDESLPLAGKPSGSKTENNVS